MVKEVQNPGRVDLKEEQINELLDEKRDQQQANESGRPLAAEFDETTQSGHSGNRQWNNRTRRNPRNG